MLSQTEGPQRQIGDLFGIRRQQRRLAGMTVTEGHYPPNLAIPRHDHRHASFCFVVEGGYDETYERHDRECCTGTMILHPEGEHHSDRHGDTVTRLLTVEFSEERLRALRDVTTVLDQPNALEAARLQKLCLTLLREFSRADDASALVVEGLVLECLGAAQRCAQRLDNPSTRAMPVWLRQVQDCLHAMPADSHSLEDLASLAGVHPMHLTRQFRQQFGCSIGDYVRKLRIDAARTLLLDSDDTIVDIAADLGFADQSHFTRLFRQYTGATPAAWRKSRMQ